MMKKILLTVLFITVLSSCGTLTVSDAEKKLVSEGKKSLLVTENRDPIYYLTGLPQLFDEIGGEPISVYVLSIDGTDVKDKWFKADEEVAVEPGQRSIEAECKEKVDSWNRDVDDKSESKYQTRTQTIDYKFEGGKKYLLYARPYIGGCRLFIKPYK